jgi:hypothetical protein
VALGSTQPLTEMSTMNLPRDKGQPALKAHNLTAMCEPIVQKMWKPRRFTASGPPRPVIGRALPFFLPLPSLPLSYPIGTTVLLLYSASV